MVTLLPPHIAHDGRSAHAEGFRKRVVYLDEPWLPADVVGLSVDCPAFESVSLVSAAGRLHRELAEPGSELAAEGTLLAIRDQLMSRLRRTPVTRRQASPALARGLRELIDSRVATGITLAEAGRILAAHPSSLGRSFHETFGIAPHAYLVSRRVDRARHLLRDGWPVAAAATASGFYDQAHLTRHFTRLLGMTPGGYRAGGAA